MEMRTNVVLNKQFWNKNMLCLSKWCQEERVFIANAARANATRASAARASAARASAARANAARANAARANAVRANASAPSSLEAAALGRS